MTLINISSCYPKSFLHLIFLLSTFAITATTIPGDAQQNYSLDANKASAVTNSDGTTGELHPQSSAQQRRHPTEGSITVPMTTSIRGYDRTTSTSKDNNNNNNKNNNKKFDEILFESEKTDVNKKLQFYSESSVLLRRRRRRDAQTTTTTTTISAQELQKISSTTIATTAKFEAETATTTTEISENLILNLSFGNLTNFHVNFTDDTISERIEAVNLSHNALHHFNASKLTKLKVLDLSYNKLNETYSLVGHEFLHTLDVSFNSLSSFSCIECENLVSLNLSNNQLTNITLVTCSINECQRQPLQLLDLSANELSDDIDPHLFDNKSNLSDLILACNRMRIINKDLFRQLRSLRRLDLSFNDISVIEREAFSSLANLQILDLSFNRLHTASLEALRAISDIARLSLAGNVMLRYALRGFAVTWSILELDYSHVGLCQVPDSLAQSVRILNLYGNFLNIICSGDFDSYPLLHKLVLSNNNLTVIEDDAMGRLEMLTILHLDNNQLTQIPVSLPSSLMKLFIQANHIANIRPDDLANLNNLELLDLSHNQIIYMPQLLLPALITLSMSKNEIEDVQRQIMKTCPNLRHVLNEGNPIKCAELLEIGDVCNEDSFALSYEYINDNIDYNHDDVKREEKHLNSKSYFYQFDKGTADSSSGNGDGGLHKCQRQKRRRKIMEDGGSNLNASSGGDEEELTVPNCWSEREKLITSLIFTNDSTSTIAASTKETTTTTAGVSQSVKDETNKTAATLKDNKFTRISPPTMTTMTTRTVTNSSDEADKVKTSSKAGKAPMQVKKSKSSGVVEIKRLKVQEKNESAGVTMKINRIKNISSTAVDDGQNGNHNSHTRALIAQIENPQLVAESEIAINRNLIDNVQKHNDYVGKTAVAQSTTSELISTNKMKAIKDNDGRRSLERGSANSTKSIDNVQTAAKMPTSKDNRNRNERPLLAGITSMIARSGNEGNGKSIAIEATDHHQQHQHSPINHTMEKWNDVRSESLNHPGLLVVISVSVGFFFIFVVVYVYRCDFIKSARRRSVRHRNGSFESINEGRDVLNDNFNNDETRSFTIESYTNSHSQRSSIQGPNNIINQSDLLPMDILNSSISSSTLDPSQSHISMHLW